MTNHKVLAKDLWEQGLDQAAEAFYEHWEHLPLLDALAVYGHHLELDFDKKFEMSDNLLKNKKGK